MPPGNQKTKVRQEFTADTRDLDRKTKKSQKLQASAAKTSVDGQRKAAAAIDKTTKTLGKLAIGIGATVAAYKGLTASVNFFAKRQQLAAASAGADIASIQRAAQGLITEQEALQFAAAAMNTEFKLSQQQMEDVARFMVVLRNQGNDLAMVQTRVTQAIVEGNSRALRPFGVIVDGTTGKIETQKAILEEITKQNNAFAGSLDLAGDSALRMGIRMQDATDRAKEGFGAFAAEATEFIDKFSGAQLSRSLDNIEQLNNRIFELKRQEIERNKAVEARLDLLEFNNNLLMIQSVIMADLKRVEDDRLRTAIRLLRTTQQTVNLMTGPISSSIEAIRGLFQGGGGPGGGGGGGGGRGSSLRGPRPPSDIRIPRRGGFSGSLGGLQAGSGLAGLGGTITADPRRRPSGALGSGDIGGPTRRDPQIQAAIQGLMDVRTEAQKTADAIMGASATINNAFAQWGAGALSLGQALRQAAGTAIADRLWGYAEEQAALGAASFLTGNPVSGAGHLAASALFAAASGKVRSVLGGDGASPSVGAAGGAGALPAGGSGGGGRTIERHFIHSEPGFARDDPRKRRREEREMMRRTRREGGSRRPSSRRG